MMARTFTKLSLYAVCLCSSLGALAQTNITANGGTLSVQYNNDDKASENYPSLIDNDLNTRYFVTHSDVWIQYKSAYSVIVNQYAISSSSDHFALDPRDWTLLGSKNGVTWDTIDIKTAQTFATRLQTNTYNVSGSTGYLYIRLHITATGGSATMQIAEWKLTGSAAGPAAPDHLSATVSGTNAHLSWTDNSTNETGFIVSATTDGANYVTLDTVAANVHHYTDSSLTPNTSYVYRVRAINAAGESAEAKSGVVKSAAVALGTDLTDYINGIVSDQFNTTGHEGIAMLVDNNIYTKYLAWSPTTWMIYHLASPGTATKYSITSGNDAPERDPKNWVFEGSNDSTTWVPLHTVNNQVFTGRQQKKTWYFTNTTPYTYYRLNVTANSGDDLIQLSELEIYGTGTGTLPTGAPAAPTGLSAAAVSGNQIQLDWTDVATNETRYKLESSTDSVNWNFSRVLNPSSSHFNSVDLSPLTTYYYRVRAENNNGNSAWVYAYNTTLSAVAPAKWQEHWFEHHELLSLVSSNSSVNMYYDDATPRTITWMMDDMTRVWDYTKALYGSFSDPKLYMVYHSNGLSGGHPATVFDYSHDFRNVADLGGEWSTRSAWNIGASIHEVGHIVEGGSKGVKNSPANAIWHDSKWMEIYIYDVTKQLGWTADAQQTYNDVINGVENYPKPGTHWFRDWFYPVYTRSDSSATLNRFFTLLSEYFPQHNGEYTRDLNLGEFVHFWSGAAKFNLKNQADTAFKWDDALELQFRQAQIDFPFTYPDAPVVPGAGTDTVKVPVCHIWPNPASSYLNVSLPAKAGRYVVSVYNMNGAKLISKLAQGNTIALNIGTLPAAVYVVTVIDERQRIVSREKVVVSGHKVKN
jgi:hypothetical protein